jgi:hypothetical protein
VLALEQLVVRELPLRKAPPALCLDCLSVSPSVSLEDWELGGENWLCARLAAVLPDAEPKTRSAGARVRNVGPLFELLILESFVGVDRRGRVIAQLSQGPCLRVTVSS